MINKSLIRLKGLNTLYKSKICQIATALKNKRTSVFEQTDFNPYHIYPLHNKKKQTQGKFLDENYKIPTIPTPVKEEGKHLLHILHKEEMNKMISRGLKKEKVFTGDKVEVEYYHSITSNKLYKYRGVVLGTKNSNSLYYNFKFLTMVSGSYVLLDYPFYSPMLASVKVLNRANLKKSKMHNIKKLNKFGLRLDEVLKGGKNIHVTKKATKALNKIESQKESIVIE
jgi:ribosomal protein L19